MHRLRCHPATPSRAVGSVVAGAGRAGGGTLALVYEVRGDLGRVRVPAPGRGGVVEGLWEHTCCEVFVRAGEGEAYHEVNLSPGGAWCAYGFGGYRRDRRLVAAGFEPSIRVVRSGERMWLAATMALGGLAARYVGEEVRLALACVIEEVGGVRSYWAVVHPAERPDFHHPASFAVRI